MEIRSPLGENWPRGGRLIPVTTLKIISGGQAGADRAALDWAIEHGHEHGGGCPRGRKAEDGIIPAKYQLTETDSANYRARTVRNVLESDATLIVNLGELDGGSLETLRISEQHGKPVRVVQLDEAISESTLEAVRSWLRQSPMRTLNIAGPRESKRPGMYRFTLELLTRVF
jgi:hypothetical protein